MIPETFAGSMYWYAAHVLRPKIIEAIAPEEEERWRKMVRDLNDPERARAMYKRESLRWKEERAQWPEQRRERIEFVSKELAAARAFAPPEALKRAHEACVDWLESTLAYHEASVVSECEPQDFESWRSFQIFIAEGNISSAEHVRSDIAKWQAVKYDMERALPRPRGVDPL